MHVSIAQGFSQRGRDDGILLYWTVATIQAKTRSSHPSVLSLYNMSQATSAGRGSSENTSLLEGSVYSIGAWACCSCNEVWFPVISLQLPFRLNYSSGFSLSLSYQVITTLQCTESAFFTSCTWCVCLGSSWSCFLSVYMRRDWHRAGLVDVSSQLMAPFITLELCERLSHKWLSYRPFDNQLLLLKNNPRMSPLKPCIIGWAYSFYILYI